MSYEIHKAIIEGANSEKLLAIIQKKLSLKDPFAIDGPLDECNTEGFTPLHLAAKENKVEALTLLLEHGANPNAISRNGNAAIHIAAHKGFLKIIERLIKNNANIELTDKYGKSALHIAAENGREAIIELLIENGARFDLTTMTGINIAHLIAQSGHAELVKFLKGWKDSLDSKDTIFHMSPVDFAYEAGHFEVVKLLEETGFRPTRVNVDLRMVFTIFGGSRKLGGLVNKKLAEDFEKTGGDGVKQIAVLRYYLEKFLDGCPDIELQKKQDIINSLVYPKFKGYEGNINQFKLEEAIKNLIHFGNGILIVTGFSHHYVPARIVRKTDGSLILKIYDKGAFKGKKVSNYSEKVYCVRELVLNDDEKMLKNIIEILIKCLACSYEIAFEKLFTDIPRIAGTEYSFSKNIVQKPFKFGKCYSSNNHLLLLDLMVEKLGFDEGKKVYKKFTFFYRDQISKAFKEQRFEDDSFWKEYDAEIRSVLLAKELNTTDQLDLSCYLKIS